jgi:hypothetical protein
MFVIKMFVIKMFVIKMFVIHSIIINFFIDIKEQCSLCVLYKNKGVDILGKKKES